MKTWGAAAAGGMALVTILDKREWRRLYMATLWTRMLNDWYRNLTMTELNEVLACWAFALLLAYFLTMAGPFENDLKEYFIALVCIIALNWILGNENTTSFYVYAIFGLIDHSLMQPEDDVPEKVKILNVVLTILGESVIINGVLDLSRLRKVRTYIAENKQWLRPSLAKVVTHIGAILVALRLAPKSKEIQDVMTYIYNFDINDLLNEAVRKLQHLAQRHDTNVVSTLKKKWPNSSTSTDTLDGDGANRAAAQEVGLS
jgi:uncharacterized membrane protein